MTVEVRYWKGVHKGGTKDYEAWSLSVDGLDQSICIKRWGKVGTIGQFKVEVYSTSFGSYKAFGRIILEKSSVRKGYRKAAPSSISSYDSFEELRRAHECLGDMKLAKLEDFRTVKEFFTGIGESLLTGVSESLDDEASDVEIYEDASSSESVTDDGLNARRAAHSDWGSW